MNCAKCYQIVAIFVVTVSVLTGSANGQYQSSSDIRLLSAAPVIPANQDIDFEHLLASTFWGGSNKDGNLETPLALDNSGNVFVAARTRSSNIIPSGMAAYDSTYNGGANDIIIAKFDSDLSTLLGATYLGSVGDDGGWPGVTLAVNDEGHVYVSGRTNSDYFPHTSGCYQDTVTGGYDAFISKFNNNLDTLLASTFIGGSSNEYYLMLELDNDGNIILAGTTNSGNFPTTENAMERDFMGGGGGPYPGDVFVSKFDSDLTALLASTYIGGSSYEYCEDIEIDDANNIYITGWVGSGDFPFVPGCFRTYHSGGVYDAFVSKFPPDLSSLTYSTFIGGSYWDFGYDMVLASDGSIYISGHTASWDFPIDATGYDYDLSPGDNNDDAFIFRLSSDFSQRLASTFLGGSDFENGSGLTLDTEGNIYVSGSTTSNDFPIESPIVQNEYQGGGSYLYVGDGFIACLTGDLSDLISSTYIGGSSYECLTTILFSAAGNMYVSGSTISSDFPTTPGSYDPNFNGYGTPWDGEGEWGGDVFISKVTFDHFTRMTEGDLVNDGGLSWGVCWTDYDNDDFPDLFVANMHEYNCLYHNNGDGAFTKVTDVTVAQEGGVEGVTGSTAAVWCDLDNDGDLDAYVSNAVEHSTPPNFLYLNNGDGTFTKVNGVAVTDDAGNSVGTACVDYDNDGDLDIITANHSTYPPSEAGANYLFRNENGEYVRLLNNEIGLGEHGGECASIADYDGDGDVDIFFPQYITDPNYLYENNLSGGGQGFSLVTSGIVSADGSGVYSMSASWGDYDNDGDLDLFVANADTDNFLYENLGGAFSKVTDQAIVTDGGGCAGSAWGDYDNDGDLDLFMTRGSYFSPAVNYLYNNDGSGNFTRVTEGVIATDLNTSLGAAWGDYDRDGDLDLYIANNLNLDENNALYRNNGNYNNWINIKCNGTISNRSAIGAKVRLKANINGDPVWQMREISGQTGKGGQNNLNVHFGLGDAVIIDSIKIEWPSGIIDVITNIDVNQFLTLTETLCGDANNDEAVNIGDVVYLVNLIFHNGPSPEMEAAGDVNCDGNINVGDAVYLGNYVFQADVPEPCANCLP